MVIEFVGKCSEYYCSEGFVYLFMVFIRLEVLWGLVFLFVVIFVVLVFCILKVFYKCLLRVYRVRVKFVVFIMIGRFSVRGIEVLGIGGRVKI